MVCNIVITTTNPNNLEVHIGFLFYLYTYFTCFFVFSQEEELRKSEEAKYAHLSNDLHVLIEVFAPPGEAYSRMSHALEEIKKFLVPVSLILHLISPS